MNTEEYFRRLRELSEREKKRKQNDDDLNEDADFSTRRFFD